MSKAIEGNVHAKETRRPARRYEETKLYINGADFSLACLEIVFHLKQLEDSSTCDDERLVPGEVMFPEGEKPYVWVLSEHAERFVAAKLCIKGCTVSFSYAPQKAAKIVKAPEPSMQFLC
jgi:hypothetical protein